MKKEEISILNLKYFPTGTSYTVGKCFTLFPAVGWHSLVNEKQEADSVSNMLQVSACGVMSIVLYFLFIVLIH